MFQETPQSLGPNKPDKRQGTIDDDPLYKEFLSKLPISEPDAGNTDKNSSDKVSAITPWVETLDEVEKREAASSQVVTVLIYPFFFITWQI